MERWWCDFCRNSKRLTAKRLIRKCIRAAIRSIFSELVLRQGRLVAIEQPVLEKPKTKEINNFLNEILL